MGVSVTRSGVIETSDAAEAAYEQLVVEVAPGLQLMQFDDEATEYDPPHWVEITPGLEVLDCDLVDDYDDLEIHFDMEVDDAYGDDPDADWVALEAYETETEGTWASIDWTQAVDDVELRTTGVWQAQAFSSDEEAFFAAGDELDRVLSRHRSGEIPLEWEAHLP